MDLRNKVLSHYAKLLQRGKVPFFVQVTVEALIPPLALVYLADWIFKLPVREDLTGGTFLTLAPSLIVLAPLLETIILQMIPVWLAIKLRLGFWPQVLSSTIVFALLHFTINWASGLFTGIYCGFYLALSYVHWRRVNLKTAFLITFSLHAVHNFFAMAAGVLSGDLPIR